MKPLKMRINFASSLTNICETNSSFDSGVLRIAYEGKNRNKSFISHDSFVRALPTIFNVPVVANYTIETDSIGGHDVDIVKDEKGLHFINLTQPLGVVPESAKQWFEDVEEDDGSVHTYLYTDVLLWKRQPAYSKIKRDGITGHSMEIEVSNGYKDKDDGYYHIDDFEFTAFCLLGDDVTPCFESSSLELFSASDFKKQLSEMMQDLKESFAKVETSKDDYDKHPHKNSMEGGTKKLDEEKMTLAESYGIDINSLDFSLEDFSVEELTEKFEAIKKEKEAAEFALIQQTIDEIRRTLDEVKCEMSWGTTTRYCYIDCDLDAGEVYAYDVMDWLVYGFNFTKDGDAISVDFDSKKRKKFAIVDFDGGEQSSAIAPVFDMAVNAINEATNKYSELKKDYDSVSELIVTANAELDELREFKAKAEKDAFDAKVNSLFSKFEDLNGIEAFENLRSDCSDLDLDTLEEKLFAIRGKNIDVLKFNLERSGDAPKIPVVKVSVVEKEPYGGIVEKYCGKN